MEEFLEPGVIVLIGGVDNDNDGDGDSDIDIDLFDDAIFPASMTRLEKGRSFASATFVEKRRSVVVCGGYVGQSRVKFAAKRLNLVKSFSSTSGELPPYNFLSLGGLCNKDEAFSLPSQQPRVQIPAPLRFFHCTS